MPKQAKSKSVSLKAPGLAPIRKKPSVPGGVGPQENVFAELKRRMAKLVKAGYLDRFEGQNEMDGCQQDPGLYDRIVNEGYNALTELAIFSIRPDIHKPIRMMAMAKVAEYTHTKADLQTRLESAAQVSNITIHIEGYARGLPDRTAEPRQVEAVVVTEDE